MSFCEFKYNKRRKHYSYIYGYKGDLRKNILISTNDHEEINKFGKKKIYANVPLYKHPKEGCNKKVYLITRAYLDPVKSFANVNGNWHWDKNDKRKVKRIKKRFRF